MPSLTPTPRSRFGLAACVLAGLVPWSAPVRADGPDCRLGPRDVPVCAFGDTSEPNVLVALVVGAGAANEGEGEVGVAHYLEHLVFRGREGQGDGDKAPGASLGAFGNAYTSHAVTAYHWTVPRARTAEAIDRALGVLDAPNPSPLAVEQERRIVLREHEEGRATVGQRLSEEAWTALLEATPFARALDGTRADVLALDAEGALAFHARHYRADNAVLVTSGPLPASTDEAPVSPRLPGRALAPIEGRVDLARTDPAAGVASRWLLAAAPLEDDARTRAALLILDRYLGGRLDGAPHRPLARDSETVKDFGAAAFLRADGVGVLEAWADLRPGLGLAALEAFEADWTDYLGALAANGLSPETVARIGTRVARALDEERGRPIPRAWSLIGWLQDGRTIAEWAAFPDTVDALPPGAVNAVLRRLAEPTRTVATDRLPPS